MESIKDIFSKKTEFDFGKPATEEQILSAEKELGLSFSNDYKEYLKLFGVALYTGHELTGITNVKRYNVVDTTKRIKAEGLVTVPDDFYVIEETNIEEMVIWQSGNGEIFATVPNYALKKLYDSFNEYISH